MDQRDPMTSYYVHQGQSTGLQNSPNMNPLSNPAVHYQSNAGGSLTVPTLPLDTMSAHGVNVGPTSAEPVRRKRGRPRKYGHDGSVSLALSPSMSNPASIAQKWRGRPPGTARKQQLSSLGGSIFSGAGTMMPHIINVAAGEDIKRKILSLVQGQRVIVILSGTGSISAANIKISSSNGSVTYEGHFDMVNLSGSYINDPHGATATGGINVTFAGPDGRLIGGPIEGVLIAASPVQVIVGIMMGSSTSKTKNKGGMEDPDRSASGDPDRSTVNIEPSQNFSAMSGWPSSR